MIDNKIVMKFISLCESSKIQELHQLIDFSKVYNDNGKLELKKEIDKVFKLRINGCLKFNAIESSCKVCPNNKLVIDFINPKDKESKFSFSFNELENDFIEIHRCNKDVPF